MEQPPGPGTGGSQPVLELSKLGVAADERRRGDLQLHQHASDHTKGALRLGFAFELERWNRFEFERALGQSPGWLGDEDAAERRGALEALGGVDRVADDRIGALYVAGE